MRVHVNPSTGNPGKCKAEKGKCPFGGDEVHFANETEARAAFEATMGAQVVSLSARRAAKAGASASEAPAPSEKTYEDFPSYLIPSADRKVLETLRAGKPVPPAKLDAFLETHRNMDKDDGMSSPKQIESAKAILSYMRAVRSQDPTPSTLATIESFDPSKETLFSNAQARKNADIMGRAIRKEFAHSEWMEELAGENERTAASYEAEGDTLSAAQYRQAAQNNREDGLRSQARVQAQLRELQYLFDKDEAFAKTANADVRRMLTQGSFRGAGPSDLAGLPIGTVKKAK